MSVVGLRCPKSLARAPTARNMIARGKREARRPWSQDFNLTPALKGRHSMRISAFQAFCFGWFW